MQQDANFDIGTDLDVFITDLSRQIDYDQPKVYSVTGTEVVDAVTYNTLETTPKQYYGYGNVSIKAWYPSGFAGTASTGVADFTVKQVQGSSDNPTAYAPGSYQCYRASDLMAASVAKQEPTGQEVNLPFRHLMTRLVVQVEFYNGFTSDDVKCIKVTADTKAKVDKETLSVTADGGQADVVISGEKEDLGVCILPPQTLAADNTVITVELRDGLTPSKLYYKPSEAMTLAGGNTYFLKLNASSATITGYVDETGAEFTAIKAWPDPVVTTNGEPNDSENWAINEDNYVKNLLGELMVEIKGRYDIDALDDPEVEEDVNADWNYDGWNSWTE